MSYYEPEGPEWAPYLYLGGLLFAMMLLFAVDAAQAEPLGSKDCEWISGPVSGHLELPEFFTRKVDTVRAWRADDLTPVHEFKFLRWEVDHSPELPGPQVFGIWRRDGTVEIKTHITGLRPGRPDGSGGEALRLRGFAVTDFTIYRWSAANAAGDSGLSVLSLDSREEHQCQTDC